VIDPAARWARYGDKPDYADIAALVAERVVREAPTGVALRRA
jgi:hypothetical protein